MDSKSIAIVLLALCFVVLAALLVQAREAIRDQRAMLDRIDFELKRAVGTIQVEMTLRHEHRADVHKYVREKVGELAEAVGMTWQSPPERGKWAPKASAEKEV